MSKYINIKTKTILTLFAVLISFSGYSAPGGQTALVEESGNYYLGAEDVLEISIWNEDKLTRQVLVRPDGWFSFPLVGEVQALGKTPDQVRREIEKKISRYIPDPVVTVLVTKVSAYKIYVIGQVKKPGQYVIGRYIDIMQALAMAGGLTPFASEDNIKILRKKKGKQQVISFQYSALEKGRKLTQNINMQSGDVIVVP